jgi:hypothetical protein
MSANPQPISRSSKSALPPPVQAPYKPDKDSWCEKERRATFLKDGRPVGFSMIPHAWYADLERIVRGRAAVAILLPYVMSYAGGRETVTAFRGIGDPPESSAIKIEQLAEVIGCGVRNLWEILTDLSSGTYPAISYRKVGASAVKIQLLVSNWGKIPRNDELRPGGRGVPRKPVERAEEAAGAEESASEEKVAARSVRTVLTRHPLNIPAGSKTSPWVPVTTGVKRFRIWNELATSLSIEAVVQAGELILTARSTKESLLPEVVSNQISNMQPKNGSALPKSPLEIPGVRRASELSSAPPPQNTLSNKTNHLQTKNGSALPKQAENGATIEKLREEVVSRGGTVADRYAGTILAALGAPLDWLMSEVDRERRSKEKARKQFDWRHLHVKVQDANQTWPAEQRRRQMLTEAARTRRPIQLSDAAKMDMVRTWKWALTEESMCSAVEKEVARQGLMEMGEEV